MGPDAPGEERVASEMRRAAVSIVTADGWTLRGEEIAPQGEPRGVAVLAHAMMVNRRTMDRPKGQGLASEIAAQGVHVFNFDLRGHGESGPTAREGAEYAYDDFVQYDMPALVDFARRRFPGRRVALVGHSLGGHAALIAAGLSPESRPDLLVAIAANLWAPRFEPNPIRRAKKAVSFAAWALATVPRGRFDPGGGASSEAEPWRYVRQFVSMFFRNRLQNRAKTINYEEAIARAEIDVVSIASEGDELYAHPDVVRRFMELAEKAKVTHRVVRHGEITERAGGRAPGHMEIVTDTACRPLWREIAEQIVCC